MKDTSNKKFDVEKRQNSLFESSVRNALLANDSISLAQNSMLALGLAELAFLGTLLANDKVANRCVIKTMIVLLVISFLSFLFGQIIQFKHQLSAARKLEAKSNKAIEFLNNGKRYLDHEPVEISINKQQIVSNNTANYLIFTSLLLIIVVTLIAVWLVVVI